VKIPVIVLPGTSSSGCCPGSGRDMWRVKKTWIPLTHSTVCSRATMCFWEGSDSRGGRIYMDLSCSPAFVEGAQI